MGIKITAKSLGLAVGGAAIAASAVLAISHTDGTTHDTVNIAKNAVNATGDNPYTAPSAVVRSGGSDSGITTTANSGG
ncbi:MAG: hypothetical protein WCE30_02970 [Mycobacterium sp.]